MLPKGSLQHKDFREGLCRPRHEGPGQAEWGPLTRRGGNMPRAPHLLFFHQSFSSEKRNSLSNFERPGAGHVSSHRVTRSSFRLFYLFPSNKVSIVCIMFLSPWVALTPSSLLVGIMWTSLSTALPTGHIIILFSPRPFSCHSAVCLDNKLVLLLPYVSPLPLGGGLACRKHCFQSCKWRNEI